MGFLYGHICHYYMDVVCHPLIRKIVKISINVGRKSHTLIEGYIDSYLVKYKYDRNIDNFNTRSLFRGNVWKIYKMIDYVYYKTYGEKYVAFSYFITKFMYSKVMWLFKIFGKKLLRRVSCFDKYIASNKELDIVNNNRKIYYNDYLGRECNKSFMELYDDSIDISIERINNLK